MRPVVKGSIGLGVFYLFCLCFWIAPKMTIDMVAYTLMLALFLFLSFFIFALSGGLDD